MTDAAALLSDLVAFPSVCRTPNGAIIEWVRTYLARHGVEARVLPGPEGDRANLFATIGPRDRAGIVLSGHLDVVPAGEGWTGDPFALRAIGDRLVGRGAVDMKGFVACLLALVPEMVRAPLARPVHLALSYDEEVGCVGVRHMIARLPELCAPPEACIVGEPSEMRPVLRHKGKVAGRLTVRGRAGHSSRPDLADNAVHLAADIVGLVRSLHEGFARQGPFHPLFEPAASTLQVGIIAGGTGVNVVPDTCRVEWEARAVPGTDPMTIHDALQAGVNDLVAPLRAAGRAVAVESEVLSLYPALDLPDDAPLRGLAEVWSGREALGAVSYGTEAGLFQAAGIPSIICGPGRIAEAHRPDESIGRADLEECCMMLRRVIAHHSQK